MSTKKRILLADEDESIVQIYHKVLDGAGYQVMDAHDGEEALNIAIKDKPDLVVLDVTMPKKDGFEVLKEIRTEGEWGKNVPVIMLTGKNLDEERFALIAQLNPSFYSVKGSESLSDFLFRANGLLGG